jgi:hypothetical protein
MFRKTVSRMLFVLLIVSIFTSAFHTLPVEAWNKTNLERKENFVVTTSTYDQGLLIGSVTGYNLNTGDVLSISWKAHEYWTLSPPRMYLLNEYQFHGWSYSRKMIGSDPASRGWLVRTASWETTVNYSVTLPDTYHVIIDNTNWNPSILPPSTEIIFYEACKYTAQILWSVHPTDFGTLCLQPGESVVLYATISVDPTSDTAWSPLYPYGSVGPVTGYCGWTLYHLPQAINPGESWTGPVLGISVNSDTPSGTLCTGPGCSWNVTCSTVGAQPQKYEIPVVIIAGNPPQNATCALTVSATTGGITVPSPGTYFYTVGSNVTVTALPNSGYEFDRWQTSGGVNVANPYASSTTAIVTGNGTATAIFREVITTYAVNLVSVENSLETANLGKISLGGTPYSLPTTAWKTPGAFPIEYNASSGYTFDHWETSGGVNLTNRYASSTSVAISGNGNITAVYRKTAANYTISLTSSEQNGTALNIGTIHFDGQPYTLPSNLTKPSGTYSINYIPSSGHKFLKWETLGNISVANSSSQHTLATVNGYGTIKAMFSKHTSILPSITEVKAFYTLDSFFLAGMLDLVPPNQYFVRGGNISMVEFTIYLSGAKQTYVDTTSDADGWFSSNPVDMSRVTSNLTIMAYSITGNSVNMTVNTNVWDTPYWFACLIEYGQETGNITISVNPTQPLSRFDNVWSISLSYHWPETPIDAVYDLRYLPIIGGKYGIKCGFGFTLGLQSNGKPVVGGEGGLQFYIADAEANIGIRVTATIIVQNGIKLESLAIRVSGAVKVPFRQSYSWNGIGFDIGIDVGGYVSFTLYLREAASGDGTFGCGLDWVATEADVGLILRPYAEIGFWRGEIRVEGEGKVTFTFHVPPPYFTYPDDLKVEARITLSARFWWFCWQAEVFRYSSRSPVEWVLESNQTGWIPRTWANGNYSLYKWDASQTEGTYLQNVYTYANPSVASSMENTIMVWTQDDLSKPYIQGYEIYYSTWDQRTGNWSLPSPITDDTIPQGDAVVEFDSNGNAVAVWTQVNNPFLNEAVDPFSLFKDVELAYAVWNPKTHAWSQPKTFTNNHAFDYMPTLISDEAGNLMLVWMSDADGNVFTYNDQSIYAVFWNGIGWSSPTLVSTPEMITSPIRGAYHNGKASLVWTQHTDGNATTVNDTEVFYTEFLDNAWSSPKKLTNNTLEETSPCVAFWNNYPIFTWVEKATNETDTLMLLDPYDENVSRLILEKPGIYSPNLIVDSENRLLVVWSDSSLPYSAVLHDKLTVTEMTKRENQTEKDIYCGIYDYAAGLVDINYDGQINIVDIAIVAKAFGTVPGSSTWNPEADLDSNKVVNIIDIAKVAKQFQKSFSDHIHCRSIVGLNRNQTGVHSTAHTSNPIVEANILADPQFSSLNHMSAVIVCLIATSNVRAKHKRKHQN